VGQTQPNQISGFGYSPFVILPFLPPTSNHIYVSNRAGTRFLSSEAKTFKTRAITHIQTECLAHISRLDRGAIYKVWYAFFFAPEDILNMTFGTGKKGSAVTRYKRMDVENRIKLVADALATAIGIDDCQFFEGGHTKLSASLTLGIPQIHIFLTTEDPRRFGLEV
jgi:hypothetical protein